MKDLQYLSNSFSNKALLLKNTNLWKLEIGNVYNQIWCEYEQLTTIA